MSLQMKGSIPATNLQEIRTYDTSYLTGWLELGQYTGYQSKIALADFNDEADMKNKIKLWMNGVNPNWFIMNAGDGNTFCVVQVIVDRNRWTAAALTAEFNNVAGATAASFEDWTGCWDSGAQAGQNGRDVPDDVSGGAFTIRSTEPANYTDADGNQVLDSAIDIAYFVRYDDQDMRESVSLYPTSDGLSTGDKNSLTCAAGRTSLSRTEDLEYDVIYQQGTDAGFISFINYDLDGYWLDVGGTSIVADVGATVGQASADWHVRGSFVDFLVSELQPLAYTCNYNGDRTNAAGTDGGDAFDMATAHGLIMMIDRPIGEIVDIIKRARHVVEENSMANDADNTASGAQIAQAGADKWWSQNYAINAAAAAGIVDYADNTEIDTGSTGDADDIGVYQLPFFFADTSGY
jgi:hypothetical protein